MASCFRLFICQELYAVPQLYSPITSQGCQSSILVIDFFQSRLLDRSDLCGQITSVSKKKKEKFCWHLKLGYHIFNYLVEYFSFFVVNSSDHPHSLLLGHGKDTRSDGCCTARLPRGGWQHLSEPQFNVTIGKH